MSWKLKSTVLSVSIYTFRYEKYYFLKLERTIELIEHMVQKNKHRLYHKKMLNYNINNYTVTIYSFQLLINLNFILIEVGYHCNY